MATATIVWTSTDGSRWDDEAKAVARDALDAQVRAIEATIPQPPKDSDRRVAVRPAVMSEAKRQAVLLCRAQFPTESVFQNDPDAIHPFSYAGRFLDDTGGPLRRVWTVFMCYHDGFVYQQPYFATNPSKWTGRD